MGKIGPNSVIQLGHALRDLLGDDVAQQVFARAGCLPMLANPPLEMIDENVPATLFRDVWSTLPETEALRVSEDAGQRTADYVLENRIPNGVKLLFSLMPRLVSQWMLLKAIKRNSWTFAGSGSFEILCGTSVIIRNNPIIMPRAAWHVAVFRRLFQRLVDPETQVHEMSGEPVSYDNIFRIQRR